MKERKVLNKVLTSEPAKKERFEKEFENWHHRLLTMQRQYGSSCPVGSCLQRDVIRDAKVKDAMKEVYWRVIYNHECPIEKTREYRKENGRYEVN